MYIYIYIYIYVSLSFSLVLLLYGGWGGLNFSMPGSRGCPWRGRAEATLASAMTGAIPHKSYPRDLLFC